MTDAATVAKAVQTADAVALCRSRPDIAALAAAFAAADPDLQVAAWQDTPVILLLDEELQTVLAVDGARLVQVPSEVRRLLGPTAPEVHDPVWWVDIHSSATHQGAPAAARRLASTLVDRHGGAVWPAEPR